MATAEVAAVHGDEIADFLERLGVADAYRSGELVCSVCGAALVEAGLGAARGSEDGHVVFACAKLECLDEFHAS